MRQLRFVSLVLVACFALVSCGQNDDPASTSNSDGEHSGHNTDTDEPKSDSPSEEPRETTEPEPEPEPEPEGNVTEISIKDGKVAPEILRVDADLNEKVTFVVTSDVDDQIHVHGYDNEYETPAGQKTTFSFKADIPGIFEVEQEESGIFLFELKVS